MSDINIEKAKEIGFCFGVKRAIDLLEKAAAQHGSVETLGAVVHNKVVIEALERKGVRVVGSLGEVKGKVVAISSHGVGPRVHEEMKALGIDVMDATCPRVRHTQQAARELVQSGFYVIVYGDANHAEVKGVLGWAGSNSMACADTESLPDPDGLPQRLGLLSQTTQSQQSFAAFAAAALARYLPRSKEIRVVNTICQATRRRQASARELARKSDIIVVVGGRSSSNTRRLVEACQATGAGTYLVETADELQRDWLENVSRIGVAAGTSTPDSAIEAVIAKLRDLSKAT